MPSIQSLTVTYDALNEYGTFSEGDTITGKVTLALLKETAVQSFFVKAKGDADVRWTRKHGDRTHTYSANRRYFKLKQIVIPESSNDTVIPKGTHVYAFSFQIPSVSMPSSFKGTHGKIVYMLEAKVSRSWKLNRSVEKEINFVSKSIPNLHSLMSRQVGSTQKEMGLFSTGQVQMDVIVDRRAYAPGEPVAIVAKVKNSSSRDMTPKFSIIQDVVYRANGSTRHEDFVIQKFFGNSIKPQTQQEVKCVLTIPRDQTQTIQNCEIISVEHHIKVYLDISFAFDPEVKFPLVIIPPELAPGRQPGVSVGPYQARATGGPSNSDFPPSPVAAGCYPASPHSGSHRYPGAQQYSAPAHAYSDRQQVYAGSPHMYPAQPNHMSGGYNNPVPQRASPYGSPFSSSSSSPVHHPPPSAPTFHPLPSAPAIHPSPSTSLTFNISPTAPSYNLLPTSPMRNTDFLSQNDEAPPAYSLLFPSSAMKNSDAKQ
ncbi:arrestin domain-containing protein 3-like [Scomber scombrus]|uniref:Arrestin domain-containing protein 3-like n=1 Tax=Scomber scombrus TaxID=13677 RepID=A0AAV1MT41_SCOSC|nr:arrestin domain-containing protein 3-like [Scomber scombrus]